MAEQRKFHVFLADFRYSFNLVSISDKHIDIEAIDIETNERFIPVGFTYHCSNDDFLSKLPNHELLDYEKDFLEEIGIILKSN